MLNISALINATLYSMPDLSISLAGMFVIIPAVVMCNHLMCKKEKKRRYWSNS